MKKVAILSLAVLLTAFASVALADGDENGNKGRLLLFQKCDQSLVNAPGYDAFGCPVAGGGPWPILDDSRKKGRGALEYSLWGKRFSFSFQGHRLPPKTGYTLIYYPDPWPGSDLICLGSGKTNKGGNVEIHGRKDIGTGLPASYDANFNPVSPSWAVGAKILLVLSDDVQCADGAKMLNWNPASYLFEYNLIVYEKTGGSSCDRGRK